MIKELLKAYTNVIITKSISILLKEDISNCIIVEDARSAVYYATGIAANSKKEVAVIVNGNNESRSAFSGMTEAYYRNLKVLLISINQCFDYTKEINDIAKRKTLFLNDFDISCINKLSLPAHAIINSIDTNSSTPIYFNSKLLENILNNDDYLYYSNNINIDNSHLKCKCVKGGTPGCNEGAIANVLGASLSNKHSRYFAIITDAEFLHDMNTLGNICYNNSIRLICLSKNKTYIDYATSLGLNVVYELEDLKIEKSVYFEKYGDML